MTDFVTLDSSHLGVDRIATSPTAFALYQNVFAFAEKAPGAPVLANSYVVEAMISSGVVSQGKLKSTVGDVSVTGGSNNLTLPGGEYGFVPSIRNSIGGNNISAELLTNGLIAFGTSFVTQIYLESTATGFARQRYIQASPPYDLGDGEIPLFIFALLDASGNVLATYTAEDPPWANNGPTCIRPDGINAQGKLVRLIRPKADIDALRDPLRKEQELDRVSKLKPYFVEVTQEMKQADMGLIPHPFLGNDLTGKVVVLVDPMSDMMISLRDEQVLGDGVADIIHRNKIHIGNAPLRRASPPGVIVAPVRWK